MVKGKVHMSLNKRTVSIITALAILLSSCAQFGIPSGATKVDTTREDDIHSVPFGSPSVQTAWGLVLDHAAMLSRDISFDYSEALAVQSSVALSIIVPDSTDQVYVSATVIGGKVYELQTIKVDRARDAAQVNNLLNERSVTVSSYSGYLDNPDKGVAQQQLAKILEPLYIYTFDHSLLRPTGAARTSGISPQSSCGSCADERGAFVGALVNVSLSGAGVVLGILGTGALGPIAGVGLVLAVGTFGWALFSWGEAWQDYSNCNFQRAYGCEPRTDNRMIADVRIDSFSGYKRITVPSKPRYLYYWIAKGTLVLYGRPYYKNGPNGDFAKRNFDFATEPQPDPLDRNGYVASLQAQVLAADKKLMQDNVGVAISEFRRQVLSDNEHVTNYQLSGWSGPAIYVDIRIYR